MAVTVSSIDRFTKLKQRRDTLSRQLAQFQGRLESSRDRYNDIMRELANYGIGSLDELRNKIASLDAQITAELDKSEEQLNLLEGELRALDS